MPQSALNVHQSACPNVSVPVRGTLGPSRLGHFEHFEQPRPQISARAAAKKNLRFSPFEQPPFRFSPLPLDSSCTTTRAIAQRRGTTFLVSGKWSGASQFDLPSGTEQGAGSHARPFTRTTDACVARTLGPCRRSAVGAGQKLFPFELTTGAILVRACPRNGGTAVRRLSKPLAVAEVFRSAA